MCNASRQGEVQVCGDVCAARVEDGACSSGWNRLDSMLAQSLATPRATVGNVDRLDTFTAASRSVLAAASGIPFVV